MGIGIDTTAITGSGYIIFNKRTEINAERIHGSCRVDPAAAVRCCIAADRTPGNTGGRGSVKTDSAAVSRAVAAHGGYGQGKAAACGIHIDPAAAAGGFVAADGDVCADRQIAGFDPDAAAVAVFIPAGDGAGAGEGQVTFGNDHAAVIGSHHAAAEIC